MKNRFLLIAPLWFEHFCDGEETFFIVFDVHLYGEVF